MQQQNDWRPSEQDGRTGNCGDPVMLEMCLDLSLNERLQSIADDPAAPDGTRKLALQALLMLDARAMAPRRGGAIGDDRAEAADTGFAEVGAAASVQGSRAESTGCALF